MPAPSSTTFAPIDDEAALLERLVRRTYPKPGLAAITDLDDAGDELGQE